MNILRQMVLIREQPYNFEFSYVSLISLFCMHSLHMYWFCKNQITRLVAEVSHPKLSETGLVLTDVLPQFLHG